MITHSKNIAVILFVLSAPALMFIAEAAGQQQRTTKQTLKQQAMMQQAMMQQPMAQNQKTPQMRTPTANSRESYTIVEVDHVLQLVTASGMKDLKKKLDDDYKTAQKAYQEAKKSKDKSITPEKPEKKTIKTIKSGIKGETKAQEEFLKLQNERNGGGGEKKNKR